MAEWSVKNYLSADGEEAAAGGVHEDEFALVAGVGLVRVDSEDELALGVVDGEAVTGEEEGGLEDGELDLLLEHEPVFDHRHCFHLHLLLLLLRRFQCGCDFTVREMGKFECEG